MTAALPGKQSDLNVPSACPELNPVGTLPEVYIEMPPLDLPRTGAASTNSIVRVILGAATGTLIEWYDFFIFGSLTTILALKFYPPGNDTFALIAYLATFAVGFLVRPFGALFFGSIGDLFGRRIAFIITLSIMGASTASIGLLPTYKTAGWLSPIILIAIRVLQGLALGGEYGGAAVYVAEHVPDNKRGFYTSFIQITASAGLLLSLAAILATQQGMSPASFQQWGWRLPFLLSLVLVSVSLYIRIRMKESPIFSQIKSAGMHSTQPLKDALTHWSNLKQILISLVRSDCRAGSPLVYGIVLCALLPANSSKAESTHRKSSWSSSRSSPEFRSTWSSARSLTASGERNL